MDKKILGFGLIIILAVVVVYTVDVGIAVPFRAGLNLYDSDGNLTGTIEEAEGTVMDALDVYFRHPVSGAEIVSYAGFIKLTAYIQEDVISLPTGIDVSLSYGMYFGLTVNGGETLQTGTDVWHVPVYDPASGADLPEWSFTYDVFQLIDYYDDTNMDLYQVITKSDGTIWISYTFPFRFVVAADWTTAYGDGGYRKMIPLYVNVEVVDVDPSTAIDLNFYAGEFGIVGGSLDTEYTPYDGLTNLPTTW